MEPFALRYAILRLIELHEARGATYLQDADIAAALGAAVREVQEQLEILEHDEFVECVKGFGPSYAARLTYHSPRLRLIAGHLRCFHGTWRAMSATSVRKIPDADTVASKPESATSLRGQTPWISIVRAFLRSFASLERARCSLRARVRKERVSVN
jgi:hypothetical protein